MANTKLTKDEVLILKHIGSEDFSPIGPVEGAAFRSLIAMGAVETKGEGCFLSDYGWELLNDMNAEARDAAEVAAMSWSD